MAPDPADAAAYLTRNAVDALPKGALEGKLAQAQREGRQLRVKLGLDPTAADIHLGHTVVLQKLREFQDLGHRVVLIVGDFTARVGDPSGRSSTRPVLSGAEIDANARTYQEQAFRVLRDDPDLYELRFNSEWLDMRMEDLFRLARTTTVAQILERDDFAKRFAARAPISILELLYPLLQGYDSVAIRSDVELGGTDQTFNLLMGREVQRAYGQEPQAVVTLPLIEGLDGVRKMSKSFDNFVGLTEPADEMFGKLMSLPDELIAKYELLCTDLGAADHERVVAGLADGSIHPNAEKRRMARTIVERFHGPGSGETAEAAFDKVFRAHETPDDIPEVALPADVVTNGMVWLPKALVLAGLASSNGEGRRAIEQGGVRVDGDPVAPDTVEISVEHLTGRVLQVGRRKYAKIVSIG